MSLLNETTGAKVAQHGAKAKPRVVVTETNHAPQKPSDAPAATHESPDEKSHSAAAAPSTSHGPAEHSKQSAAPNKGH